jgi:hypothetical protein
MEKKSLMQQVHFLSYKNNPLGDLIKLVTAIVIPIICFYFYWMTRKEMREQDLKWLAAGNVLHEAVLTGQIKDIVEEKQKYYRHRYIFVQELKLQTETKTVYVKKITPLTKDLSIESFNIGDFIKVIGMWEGTQFYFDHSEKIMQNRR